MLPSKSLRATVKYVSIALIIVLSCSQLLPVTEAAQEQEFLDAVTRHKRVVDLVFRYEPFDHQHLGCRIVLRFLPDMAYPPESQIIISERLDGSLEVMAYTLADQRKHLWAQVDNIMEQTGVENPEELAKLTRVNIEKVNISPDVLDKLLKRYSRLRFSPYLETGVQPGGAVRIFLHPTTYDLWLETAVSSKLHFSLTGPDYGYDKGAHPVIRWMNQVRAVVEQAKGFENSRADRHPEE